MELLHEAARIKGRPRDQIIAAAKAKKETRDPPSQPTGPHYIDIGVRTVVPNAPIVFLQKAASGASIALQPHQLFPIVEGFFGPLRVPLPATSAALDAEYTMAWRNTYAIKTFGTKSGVGKYIERLDAHCKRAIHPAVPLEGCPTYLGCFSGASCDASPSDVAWRWSWPPAASSASSGGMVAPGALCDHPRRLRFRRTVSGGKKNDAYMSQLIYPVP